MIIQLNDDYNHDDDDFVIVVAYNYNAIRAVENILSRIFVSLTIWE